MADKEKRTHDEPLEDEELEEQNGELLPDREAMSMIQPPGPPTIPIEPTE